MKLIPLVLFFITFSASAQDKVVLHSDTIDCVIGSVEATGVSFEFEDRTRRMGLDIVDAIYYRGRWLSNQQVRNLAAAKMAVRDTERDADPIIKMEYPATSAVLYLDRAGKQIQVGVIALVAGSVGAYLLATDYPDLSVIVGVTGVVGSLVAFFFAGDQLRKSARVLHNQ